jgi:heme/copper-type cytochrome/quinol oxidase subunit 3
MADAVAPPLPVTVAPQGRRASAWYGMLFLIATEAALFVYLLFSYFFLSSRAPSHWPPSGALRLDRASLNTVLLLASSATAWWGQRGIEKGSSGRLIIGLVLTFALGAIFSGIQIFEWEHKPFSPATNAYGSLYYTITGLHIAHVAVGLIMIGCLAGWAAMGRFSAQRHLHVIVGVLYWHFVDVVWLVVFSTFFLSPYLG